VDREPAPAKVIHGFHLATPEEPEQRTMGVDGQHFPPDAVVQPRRQGPAQTDGCATAQALGFPPDSVADGDMDA
jgi:hypothetical protein